MYILHSTTSCPFLNFQFLNAILQHHFSIIIRPQTVHHDYVMGLAGGWGVGEQEVDIANLKFSCVIKLNDGIVEKKEIMFA